MTNVNGRGDNDEPIIWGVSHVDGITPVQIQFDPTTRAVMTDAVTEIEFDPEVNAQVVPSNVNLAKATASENSSYTTANQTIRPWVVNADTGAILIET